MNIANWRMIGMEKMKKMKGKVMPYVEGQIALHWLSDIHGDPLERFSFKTHPELRTLKQDDIMFVLGDFGLPFATKAVWYDNIYAPRDRYNIRWLAEKPFTIVACLGNHDDRCAISKMPLVEAFGGLVRQMEYDGIVYPNIYLIDAPGVYNFNGRNCLVIPGAESRDAQNLLDPHAEDFKVQEKAMKRNNKWYRIKDWTWWEDEAIEIPLCEMTRRWQDWDSQHFDYILTHDSPALFCELFASGHGYREAPTEGELYLDKLRQELDFKCFLHGHQHMNRRYPAPSTYTTSRGDVINYPGDSRVMCLYEWIIEDNTGQVC